MIKPPVIPNSSVSNLLAEADAALLPNYLAQPVGLPFRGRIEASQRPLREIVKAEFQKRDKQGGGIITSRSQYMKSANKSLNGVMKRNDIYSKWVSMITK